MGESTSCEFCEIVAGHEPARVVMRQTTAVAFFPVSPATLGHVLVVPTTHIPDVWSLDEQIAASLLDATLRVARAVRRAFNPDGLNLIQSNGAVATQTVDHLHVHVLPRYEGDAMGPIWPEPTDTAANTMNAAWLSLTRELR